MSVELKEDMGLRDLLDRCIKAEVQAHVYGAQARTLRQAVRSAVRTQSIDKIKGALNQALVECDGMSMVLPY